jgi:hypothetical protein
MTDPALRFHFQDVKGYIDDSIYKPWGTVFNQLGTAFNMAHKNHTENLPRYAVGTAGPDFMKDYVMAGAVAWLAWGGPKGLLLVPIVNGINLAVAHLYKRPKNVKIESPAIDLTPAEFSGSLKHVLDTAFQPVLEFLNACIRHSDVSEKIPMSSTREVWSMLGLSPTSYVPKDWKTWKAEEIAAEFERQLWVKWAKNIEEDVAKNKKAGTLRTYSYRSVLVRLADVTKWQRDGQAEAFARMAQEHPDNSDNEKLNVISFVKVLKWAQNYRPLMKFDYPLPGAVVSEMQRLDKFPAHVDTLLLGAPLLRAR